MTNMQKGRLSNLGRQLGRTILNGVREAGPASLRLANRGALHGVNALERIGYMTPRNATNTRIGIEAAGLVDSMRERGRNSITGRRSYMGDIKELSPQHEKLLSRVRANNPYIYDRATDVMQDYPLNAPEHFATNSFRMADNNGQRKIRRPLQDLSRNRLSLEQNNYERLRGKVANGLLGATVGGLGGATLAMASRKQTEPSPYSRPIPYGRPMGKSMSKSANVQKGRFTQLAQGVAQNIRSATRKLKRNALIRFEQTGLNNFVRNYESPLNAARKREMKYDWKNYQRTRPEWSANMTPHSIGNAIHADYIPEPWIQAKAKAMGAKPEISAKGTPYIPLLTNNDKNERIYDAVKDTAQTTSNNAWDLQARALRTDNPRAYFPRKFRAKHGFDERSFAQPRQSESDFIMQTFPHLNSRPMGKSMSKRATMEKGWLRDAARSLARTGRDLGESASIRIRKPISEARMAAMVTPINAGSYHTVRALEKLRVIRPETARVLKENIINGARVDTNQMMDFAAAHNDAIDRAVSRGGRFLGSDPSKLKMRTAGSNPTSDIKFLMRNGVAPEKIAPLLEGRRSTLTDAEALSGHAYQLGRHKVINTIQDVLSRRQRMRKKPISDNVFLQMMDEHRFNRKLADRYNRTKPTLKKSMSAITKSADMEKPSMPSTKRDIKHTNKYF